MDSERGTRRSMPFHHWEDEVQLAVIHAGYSGEVVQAVSGRLLMWYQAGESLDIAIDGLKQLARGYMLAEVEDANARVLRQSIRRSEVA